MEKFLNDIRVLDFGRYIAAPYCGMILAEMGAEVIRIERPGGEEDRTLGLVTEHGENLGYASYARNKLAITLNLLQESNEHVREVLTDLVGTADIVLHNFSPAATKRFMLRYQDFRQMKEDIIYAGVSCYGKDGPYADKTGFDQIAQCFSGSAYLTGLAENGPMRTALPWVDYSTGLATMTGVLMALRHRDQTGQGQSVDSSLVQTALSFMTPIIAEAEVLGQERPQLGNRNPYSGPSDIFACQDGYIFLATVSESMWRRLIQLIGHNELLDDPELSTTMDRFNHRDRVDPLIADWLKQYTVKQALEIMAENRIPCDVCHRASEVATNEQVVSQDMLEYMDLELAGLGQVPVSKVPVNLSAGDRLPGRRAPRVAEHNDYVYRELLGYSAAKTKQLQGLGII